MASARFAPLPMNASTSEREDHECDLPAGGVLLANGIEKRLHLHVGQGVSGDDGVERQKRRGFEGGGPVLGIVREELDRAQDVGDLLERLLVDPDN